MRFAICNELFEDWPWERVCSFVAECGYGGLEIAPFTLAERIDQFSFDQRRALAEAASTAGVEIVGLHWLLAKTEGLHLTSPDETVRARTASYLAELARACRDLGGHVLVFGSPQQRNLLPGVSLKEAMTWAAEVFRSIMPTLQECGVVLCVEPLAPAETNFLTSCAEAWELVQMVDHPHCKLHLDVKAMSAEGTPIPELIRRWAPRAGHFHANDANLRGPGFGAIDFVPIFEALLDAGYQGWVSVEVFDFQPDPETIARRSIDYMRDCLNRIGAA